MPQIKFTLPPQTLNDRGGTRHVGFEFEYAGLGTEDSARIIVKLFGGRVSIENRFSYKVSGARFGDFSVESDASLLKNRRYEAYLKKVGVDFSQTGLGQKLEDLIESATADFVPLEIVTPPIPFGALEEVDKLREELRAAGATGTHANFFAAFGMQFNPELPALDEQTLLNYMRSFFLLYDRLRASADVPIARRILPYIDPFPDSYIERVLSPDYMPERRRLIEDYLEENPTRNRPLDWLPLFAHLEPDIVFASKAETDLIKPRPTLHYRLPSSLIDDPDWSVAAEWNKWVEIERLAANPELIAEMSREYIDVHGPFVLRSQTLWRKRSDEWLNRL